MDLEKIADGLVSEEKETRAFQIRVRCSKVRTWIIHAKTTKAAKELAIQYARELYCDKDEDKATITSVIGPI